MRHRHLEDAETPLSELGLAALDDLLDRGDLDDWQPVLTEIVRDPWSGLAQRLSGLLEHRPPGETTTLWRSWLEQQRQNEAGAHAGVALRALRLSRGLTQQQLAARLGTVQPEVSKLERRRDTRLSTVRAYVAALGGRLRLTARFADGDVELE